MNIHPDNIEPIISAMAARIRQLDGIAEEWADSNAELLNELEAIRQENKELQKFNAPVVAPEAPANWQPMAVNAIPDFVREAFNWGMFTAQKIARDEGANAITDARVNEEWMYSDIRSKLSNIGYPQSPVPLRIARPRPVPPPAAPISSAQHCLRRLETWAASHVDGVKIIYACEAVEGAQGRFLTTIGRGSSGWCDTLEATVDALDGLGGPGTTNQAVGKTDFRPKD